MQYCADSFKYVIYDFPTIRKLEHLEQRDNSSYWMGRLIHRLMASLESIPIIKVVIAIADAFFSVLFSFFHTKQENQLAVVSPALPWKSLFHTNSHEILVESVLEIPNLLSFIESVGEYANLILEDGISLNYSNPNLRVDLLSYFLKYGKGLSREQFVLYKEEVAYLLYPMSCDISKYGSLNDDFDSTKEFVSSFFFLSSEDLNFSDLEMMHKKIAFLFHPDRNRKDEKAALIMKATNQAFDIYTEMEGFSISKLLLKRFKEYFASKLPTYFS